MNYFEYEEINCFELVNYEKVGYCTIIEDQKVESYELIDKKYVEIIECELIEDQKVEKIEFKAIIEDQKVEYCIIIEDQKVESYELIEDKYAEIIECESIEDQKVENNANQLIKEIIESCELIEDQEDIDKLNEYLEIIFNKTVKTTFNESPFKSLISDIRSILTKDGYRELKKCLKYIRELRKSTTLEIKNIKNELIKIKNKRLNRNKKEVRDCYQENKFYGVKHIRNLFDDYDDDIYEGIKYLFDEKIMHYYFKQNAFEYKVIEHQKVEYINMLKSSKNESDKIKELELTMKELKAIARKIGVNNYENISRIRLLEEIDKLEQSKELKNNKSVSSLLLKGKERIGFKLRKGKKENKQKISIGIKSEKKNTRNC